MNSTQMFKKILSKSRMNKIAFAAPLILLAFSLTACNKKPAVLTEESLHKFYDAGLEAAGKRDTKGTCAQYAESAEIRTIKFSQNGSEKLTQSKAEYCQALEDTYAQLNAMRVSTSMNVNITDIAIVEDGKSADVTSKVSESMSVMGNSIASSSEQTDHIELIAGKPLITKTVIRVTGAS